MGTDEAAFRRAERALWSSVGVEPHEVWVDRPDGGRTRVQVVGDGPPVLLLHGVSSSGANWAPLVAGLAGFRCLVVDRPGCGLSDPLDGGAPVRDLAELERHADRLVAGVLDGLAIDRSHVISTSLGAWFALRGVAAAPRRIDRIVTLAWPMGAPITHAPVSMRIASIPGLGMLMTRVPPTRRAVIAMMKQVGLRGAFAAGRVSDEMVDWFIALLRHTDTMRNEIRANPQVITPIRGINEGMLLRDDLTQQIELPALFLWGDDDPLGGADIAVRFTSKFTDARLEMLPGAGHAPWIDEPERCAELIAEFLSS